MNAEDAEDAEDGSTERTPLYFLGTWYSTPNAVMPPRSMFHKATGGLFEKKKPRAQAGHERRATIHDLPGHERRATIHDLPSHERQATIHDLPSHERRATIHDLPSPVLARRVAAHLSAADALKQLTGKRVVTTWVKDARYEFGIGSKHDAARDTAREKRLVQEKMKANPGASVVLLTGHLER